jgi:epoxide hydrolase 4
VNLRHEWRDVNGVRLHCAVAGSGPLIVLLHGFPEFWYSWRHQIPLLAEHFTVVAPDMRGYNLSDKPPCVSDYALPTLVEDIAQLIESFGAERAVVAGHDWGAIVAWAIAMSRPTYVDRLIIMNVPHPRLFAQHLLTNGRQRRRSLYAFFFQLPWLPEIALRANNYAFIEQAFRGMAVHRERFDDEVIEQYRAAIARPGALTAALNYYRALGRSGLTPLSAIDPVVRQPTLVAWGERDVALGKELNEGLERYVPDLTLHYIADASHWVQQDRPDLVNDHLRAFLGIPG